MKCLSRPYHFTFFKGCLPQIPLGPFFNSLLHIKVENIAQIANAWTICFCYHLFWYRFYGDAKTIFQKMRLSICGSFSWYSKVVLFQWYIFEIIRVLFFKMMNVRLFIFFWGSLRYVALFIFWKKIMIKTYSNRANSLTIVHKSNNIFK